MYNKMHLKGLEFSTVHSLGTIAEIGQGKRSRLHPGTGIPVRRANDLVPIIFHYIVIVTISQHYEVLNGMLCHGSA